MADRPPRRIDLYSLVSCAGELGLLSKLVRGSKYTAESLYFG
jgi:hypothetical protein